MQSSGSGNRREKSARKPKKGHLSDEGSSDEAVVASSSSGAAGGGQAEEQLTQEEKDERLIDQLAEKRTSTRVSALGRLIDMLQTDVLYDFVSARASTLSLYLQQSVKKGETAEVVLACRALSLVAVTLGAESDKLAAECTPQLVQVMSHHSRSDAARAAAADAIGMLHFVDAGSDHDTEVAMQLLIDQLRVSNLPEGLATAAWQSWALLASTLPSAKLAGELLPAYMPALMQYLDYDSIDVKTAAGMAISLLWEAKLEMDAEAAEAGDDEPQAAAGAPAGEDELTPLPESAVPTLPPTARARSTSSGDEDERKSLSGASPQLSAATQSPQLSAATQSPALRPQQRAFRSTKLGSSSRKAGSSSASVVSQSALVNKLRALATDSSRSQSKKQRAMQKRTFREFVHTLEDGELPHESLKIEKSRHEFDGWAQMLQLDALRDLLSKGLNAHLIANPLLADVFDLFIESGDGVDDPSRKEAAREASKQKQRANFEERKKGRMKKHAMAGTFGTEDD